MNERCARLLSATLKYKSILDEIDYNIDLRKDGKWNEKQILGHLIDSAINNYRRFIIGYQSDKLIFEGYEQDEWVNLQTYQEVSWKGIVETWYHLNTLIIHLLENFDNLYLEKMTTEHNFDQIGFKKVISGSPSSLGFLIDDYIDHMVHHLHQIVTLKKNVETEH